jgi:TPR repeat protein
VEVQYIEILKDLISQAENGNAEIQFQLARVYDDGKLVPRDFDKALHWYKKAAMNEYEEAQFTLDIIEADELIAVWRYRQANRFQRSVDFSSVPQEWRYSTPPPGNHECIPCHVSYRRKKSVGYSSIKPDN